MLLTKRVRCAFDTVANRNSQNRIEVKNPKSISFFTYMCKNLLFRKSIFRYLGLWPCNWNGKLAVRFRNFCEGIFLDFHHFDSFFEFWLLWNSIGTAFFAVPSTVLTHLLDTHIPCFRSTLLLRVFFLLLLLIVLREMMVRLVCYAIGSFCVQVYFCIPNFVSIIRTFMLLFCTFDFYRRLPLPLFFPRRFFTFFTSPENSIREHHLITFFTCCCCCCFCRDDFRVILFLCFFV